MPPAEQIESADDSLHEHGGTPGWRERLTFTFFDASAGFAGVARMSLLPSESQSEATVNVFLPDGSLATVLSRGDFDRTSTVGRLRFEPKERLQTWEIHCSDTAVVLKGLGPAGLPRGDRRTGGAARVQMDLRFEAWASPFGAVERERVVDEMNFVQVVSRGSFEQAGRISGTIRVGAQQGTIDGGCIRERIWGPAAEPDGDAWWLAAPFGPAATVSLHGSSRQGVDHAVGWTAAEGSPDPLRATAATFDREGRTVRTLEVRLPGEPERTVVGTVRATIPMREGGMRVQQSLVEYRLGERTCWGLAEFTRS